MTKSGGGYKFINYTLINQYKNNFKKQKQTSIKLFGDFSFQNKFRKTRIYGFSLY